MFELSLELEIDVEQQPVARRLETNASEWYVLSYSVSSNNQPSLQPSHNNDYDHNLYFGFSILTTTL